MISSKVIWNSDPPHARSRSRSGGFAYDHDLPEIQHVHDALFERLDSTNHATSDRKIGFTLMPR